MADINGTAGADLLFGAATGDLISGGDGNDIIYGGAGDDHLVGGDGDDILRGEAGNDLLEGGAGNDDLSSTDQGDDILMGGDGNDVLFADRRRAGDSLVLDGGAGNDRIVLQLTAAATALTAAAGDGDDSVEVFALRSLLNLSLGAGRDLVTPVGLRTSVQGGGGIVISDFQAGAAGDRISFSSLTTADFTGWNLNANPFAAGFLKAAQSGADVVISASFTANGTFVDAIVLQNVLLASLTADNLGGWTWDGSAVPAQTITGSGVADTLRGNGGADEIFGLGGDDILEGHAGSDTLWGGEGNDILRGGQGADQIHGESGNDTMSAETIGDSLFGEDGDDRLTLSAGTGVGTVSGSGGAGNDTITISGGSTTTTFNVDSGSGADLVAITLLAGSAVIALGEGRDRLDIDSFTKSPTSNATIEVTDFATGDGGDRLEWLGFLERTLIGGPGSARLLQSGTDSLLQIDRDGGGQYVTLINFRNTDAAAFTTYNLGGYGPDVPGTTVAGTADPDILFGTDGDDLIEGQGGRDTLLGFFGDDEIHGGGGDDSIFGSYGDDVIDGGDGNDVINVGQGDDLADGGEGDDQFIDNSSSSLGNKGFVGGAGDDSFYFFRQSNSGDTLVATGGDGNDFFQVINTFSFGHFILDGGAGNDIFDLQGRGSVTLGTGVDEIRFTDAPINTDFQSTINIQDFAVGDLGDRLSFANLVYRFVNFTPTANPFTSGYLKLVQNGSSVMIYADLDGPSGTIQDRLVAILSGVQKYSLTSHNIGGYGLPFTIGTGADEVFQGNSSDNDFVGGGGNDTFLVGYGGTDFATGGSGNDLFYVATANSFSLGNVYIAGGEGTDTLQVQAKSADMYLMLRPSAFGTAGGQTIPASGIEIVQLLSGFDSSRGWALNSAVAYTLDIANGFAPTGAPLILDTTLLAASERLSLERDALHDSGAFLKLIGGAGVDRVFAAAGGSYLDGGGGNDELFTGLGSDTLIGGVGADFLSVTASSGSSNVDILDAGEGNDRVLFTSVTGAVTVTLGAGSDTIEFSTAVYDSIGPVIARNVTVTDFAAGPGGDNLDWNVPLFHYLVGEYGNPFETGYARLVQDGGDVLLQLSRLGDGNFLTLLRLQNHVVADFASGIGGFVPPGNGGDDILTGTGGDDQIDGGAGNDLIDGGVGADRMTGGTGNDIFYVDNAGDQVIEAAGEGTDEIRTGLAVHVLAANVENLTATSAAVHDFRGNASNNSITGGGGSDVLRLYDGGDDIVLAGAGNDNIFFIGSLTAADVVNGGDGVDTLVIQGPYGSLALSANVTRIENVSILGGNNTSFGEPGTNRYDYVLTTNDANFAAGVQARINGAALLAGEDFTFDGSAETDAKYVVYGGKGKDTLTGGLGNDIFFYAEERFASGDVVNGGSGYDGMFLRGNYTIDFTAPGYSGLFTSIENLTLTSATDERYARGGGSEFDYNLILSDAIVKPGEQLTISGAILMASETMILDASQEADGLLRLFGGKANDTLKGGGQNDLLHGNLGADVLAGNGGSDAFRYQEVAESNSASRDQILDFTPGTDKIELDRIDANTLIGGDQGFSWIGSNAFSGQAGQLRAYQQGGTWILEGDVNGDSVADLVIGLNLQGPTPLGAGDFLL